MISVSLENLSKKFGDALAVDDLSLHIREGELFFLLGPSGCGKTTCLRMIAGFLTPDAGHIKFGERVIDNVPPHKRNTGMVFQNYALWPHMTVAQNVEYGLKVRKVERAQRQKQVQEALDMVRLSELGARYPSQLSGGQQQRVALARALVIRPDALLLDEPLSNLDARLRLEMRGEIKRLHEQTQTTAIYVTHDQEEALSIADRIAVLHQGKLAQVGTPRELYRAPNSRFVAEFLGESNFIAGKVAARDGEICRVETEFGVLNARGAGEVGAKVWWAARPESFVLQSASGENRASENELKGTVRGAVYGGSSEQLALQLATLDAEENELLKVALFNPGARAHYDGETLAVRCASADAFVLPREAV